MLHNVLNSGLLEDTEIPFAIARVATGLFFALSGFHKLFNRARHRTLVNTLNDCGVPYVPAMQWFVPSVELSAGLCLAFGFLTPLAALGLIAICVVATCTDGLKRIRSWQPLDKADAVDDLLYLPEFIYIILLSFFVAAGAGPLRTQSSTAISDTVVVSHRVSGIPSRGPWRSLLFGTVALFLTRA
jgi:putative oxidoreductase